jgi:hypothetical protein
VVAGVAGRFDHYGISATGLARTAKALLIENKSNRLK